MGERAPARVDVCVWVPVSRFTHNAKRMRRIMLSSVASLAPSNFRNYFINCTIFGKKVIEHKMCFDCFYNFLSEIFLILRRIQLYIVINMKMSSCKVLVVLVMF